MANFTLHSLYIQNYMFVHYNEISFICTQLLCAKFYLEVKKYIVTPDFRQTILFSELLKIHIDIKKSQANEQSNVEPLIFNYQHSKQLQPPLRKQVLFQETVDWTNNLNM